jgi:PBSX family phage terminase large subunit
VKTVDLFPPCKPAPDCPVPGCTDKRENHKHILPNQKEFLEANEKFIALIGGYGSAKTLAVCVLGHLLSVAIPGNMGIVLRRSLPKLNDSTKRIYLEVLQRSGVSYKPREMRDGWPGRVVYSNGSEVVFRETKDLGRFLGPEYGWFYIDEAQEEPEKTFNDLVGRLRLPRAAKFLRGIIATNPPARTHWIAKKFPKPGRWTVQTKLKSGKIVNSTYRMIQSSTYENPFLADGYIAGILENNTEAEARRIIEGYYGFVQEGTAVYPKFNPIAHVGEPKMYKMALYRVWDFGFHQPAVLYSQIFRCQKGSLHLNVLHETEHANLFAEDLADIVIPETRKMFPDLPPHLVVDGGDAAGAQINDKGPGPLIRLAKPMPEGRNLRFRYRKWPDIDPGLDEVRKLFKNTCPCKVPLLVVHRRCRWLIEALAGGYHYGKEKVGHEKSKKPVKDGYYDNIADTLRYTVMLFYVPRLTSDDDFAETSPFNAGENPEPWGWMERLAVN